MYAMGIALIGLSLISCNTSSREEQGTVVVMGTGAVWTQPDMAQIDVSLIYTAATAQGAKGLADQTPKAVIRILQEKKAGTKSLKTTVLNYQADCGCRNGRCVFLRQSTRQNVEVAVRNIVKVDGRLSALLNKLADISSVGINDVSFDIDEKAELFKRSHGLVHRKARERAGQYATLRDRKLGKVVTIVENNVSGVSSTLPGNHAKLEYKSNDMATVPTGQNEISIDVQAAFSLEW